MRAQNLVPNPSFEDTVSCPIGLNQVENAVGWKNFRGTPDYFNACASQLSGVSVPGHWGDYQCPSNGNAYFGILVYGPWGSDSYKREFFGTHLSSPLVIGQKYFVSFKLNLSDQSFCACNKIGALFSTVLLPNDTFSLFPLNNFAHIYTDSIIMDTVNWVVISKSFVADSNYIFVFFGNFFDDQNTDTLKFIPSTGCNPYYYIDDVCISSDSIVCVIPDGSNVCHSTGNVSKIFQNKEQFVVYPNPSKDKIIITKNNKYSKEIEITVSNITGQKILFEKFQSQKEINISNWINDIYILKVQSGNNIEYKKLIKQ